MDFTSKMTFPLLFLPLISSAWFNPIGANLFTFPGSSMIDSISDVPPTLDLEVNVPSPLSIWPRDKVYNLCHSISEPDHGQAILGLTPALFQNFSIRGDWKYAQQRLKEMEDCPAAFENVRMFKFDIHNSDTRPPPKYLPSQLTSQLKAMQYLENLVIIIPESHAETFARHFSSLNSTLSNVHTLVLGPWCHFVMATCPNIRTLSTNGYQWRSRRPNSWSHDHTLALIDAAGHSAPNITNLQINERWTIPLLEKILHTFPKLPDLTMEGSTDFTSIEDFVPTLSRFHNLRRLALAEAASLGVGFERPFCGNAYFDDDGNDDIAFIEALRAQELAAEEKVGGLMASSLGRLEEVWIGDRSRAEVRRDGDGGVEGIVWHREG